MMLAARPSSDLCREYLRVRGAPMFSVHACRRAPHFVNMAGHKLAMCSEMVGDIAVKRNKEIALSHSWLLRSCGESSLSRIALRTCSACRVSHTTRTTGVAPRAIVGLEASILALNFASDTEPINWALIIIAKLANGESPWCWLTLRAPPSQS